MKSNTITVKKKNTKKDRMIKRNTRKNNKSCLDKHELDNAGTYIDLGLLKIIWDFDHLNNVKDYRKVTAELKGMNYLPLTMKLQRILYNFYFKLLTIKKNECHFYTSDKIWKKIS